MNRSDNDWPPRGTLAWVLTGVGVWFAVGALVTCYYMRTPIESSLGTRGLMLAPQLLLFSLLAVMLALRAHRRGTRLASSIFSIGSDIDRRAVGG